MNIPSDDELQNRVRREQAAHDVDDVLARSYALKNRFSHVQQTPGWLEMEARQATLIQRMNGADVLDYGCGRGEMSERYLDAGARHVHGIDISQAYVKDAGERCIAAGQSAERFTFQVMDAHALTFPSDSFDWVIGRGILHHLDLPIAIAEIKRVLRPGGHAVFLEPLADNPLLRLFRILTPKARTTDEQPLTGSDLELISRGMIVQTFYFGLFSSPAAMFTSIMMKSHPSNLFIKFADRLETLVRKGNYLNSYHQYAFIVLRHPAA